ncbi:MAG TPA: type II secretion system protein GspG, partial [Candidatus Binatia bacterium]
QSPGQNGPYDLVSYGADGVPGGERDNGDVSSWQE